MAFLRCSGRKKWFSTSNRQSTGTGGTHLIELNSVPAQMLQNDARGSAHLATSSIPDPRRTCLLLQVAFPDPVHSRHTMEEHQARWVAPDGASRNSPRTRRSRPTLSIKGCPSRCNAVCHAELGLELACKSSAEGPGRAHYGCLYLTERPVARRYGQRAQHRAACSKAHCTESMNIHSAVPYKVRATVKVSYEHPDMPPQTRDPTAFAVCRRPGEEVRRASLSSRARTQRSGRIGHAAVAPQHGAWQA